MYMKRLNESSDTYSGGGETFPAEQEIPDADTRRIPPSLWLMAVVVFSVYGWGAYRLFSDGPLLP